jgi:hypothetical protein
MNHVTAYRILARTLEKYRARDFSDLASSAGKTISEEIRHDDGTLFHIDIAVRWVNDGVHRNILLRGRIDAAGAVDFDPLEEKLIIRDPTG